MLARLFPPYTLLLYWAAFLHLYWASALWVQPGIVWTTPFGGIWVVCGQSRLLTASVLVLASLGTLVMLTHRTISWWVSGGGMLQQALMLCSAGGCVYAAWRGVYLDGTVMNAGLIFADQLAAILAIAFHTLSLFLFHRQGKCT